MPTLIDTSLWIDFTRTRSPRSLKQFIAPYILASDAVLADPVIFEILRYATDQEVRQLQSQFQTIPTLATPSDLWNGAAMLGQKCRKAGINPGALDLLIAFVATSHDAQLITFDVDFSRIANICDLRVKLLHRPA